MMPFRQRKAWCAIAVVTFALILEAAAIAFPLRGMRPKLAMAMPPDGALKDVVDKLRSWGGIQFAGVFAAGILFGGLAVGVVSPPWRCYSTAADIPASAFERHLTVKGDVASVADGDSIRVKHQPTISLGSRPGGKLVDTTIAVRFYGVDAPETAKFGKAGQPFSEEAKAFVKGKLQGRRVRVRLLRRDQYGRAVAKVVYGTWPLRHDISEDLLKRGLATIYRGGGAEYDGQKAKLESLEAASKRAKRGLWSAAHVQLPGDYKRNQRAAAARGVPAAI